MPQTRRFIEETIDSIANGFKLPADHPDHLEAQKWFAGEQTVDSFTLGYAAHHLGTTPKELTAKAYQRVGIPYAQA